MKSYGMERMNEIVKEMRDINKELIEKNEQLQSQVAKYEMIIDDLDSENFFLGQQVAQKEHQEVVGNNDDGQNVLYIESFVLTGQKIDGYPKK